MIRIDPLRERARGGGAAPPQGRDAARRPSGRGRGPLAKVLPYHRVAGKLMFAQTDIDRLIMAGRVSKAAAE